MTNEQRLETLEREVLRARRQSRAAMAAVGLAAGIGLICLVMRGSESAALAQGGDQPKVVRVTKLIVEDLAGRPRAALGTSNGEPVLHLLGEDGRERLTLCLVDGAPALALSDDNGRKRIALAFGNGNPGLLFFAPDGETPSAVLDDDALAFKSPRGESMLKDDGLTLFDRGGIQRALLTESGLALLDERERLRAALVVHEGNPSLDLQYENGAEAINLSALDGDAALTVSGGDKEPRATFGVFGGSPRLSLRVEQESAALGSKGLTLTDQNGTPRATLTLLGETGSGLALFDERQRMRATLSVSDENPVLHLIASGDGDAKLIVSDGDKRPRAMFGLFGTSPRLSLIDEHGNGRADLTLREGKPGLRLIDESGTGRAVLGATSTEAPNGKVVNHPESSLLLFAPDGKLLWSAPK